MKPKCRRSHDVHEVPIRSLITGPSIVGRHPSMAYIHVPPHFQYNHSRQLAAMPRLRTEAWNNAPMLPCIGSLHARMPWLVPASFDVRKIKAVVPAANLFYKALPCFVSSQTTPCLSRSKTHVGGRLPPWIFSQSIIASSYCFRTAPEATSSSSSLGKPCRPEHSSGVSVLCLYARITFSSRRLP
jgi:hypothetical protein